MEEPSVLDYVKAKLRPWRGPAPAIPAAQSLQEEVLVGSVSAAELPISPGGVASPAPVAQAAPAVTALTVSWPWRSLLALVLALAAQRSLEPQPERTWVTGVIFFFLALATSVWAVWQGEWRLASLPQAVVAAVPMRVNLRSLGIGLVLAFFAFALMGGNRFTGLNVLVLLSGVYFIAQAFWVDRSGTPGFWARTLAVLRRTAWQINISRWSLAVAAAFLLAIAIRFYNIQSVPSEMNSDHAEKLLDVIRLLEGQTQIFFPANGGREAFQFYFLASLVKFFGFGLNFFTLKFSTVVIGLLSLPFIYMAGKEIGGRRIGLLALLFAGVAYWPNVVSRVGLRLPFYIFFSAALFYFLLRALRTAHPKDFVWAGVILGLSFYGYSADRILPILVVTAVGLFLLHRQPVGMRKQVFSYSLVIVLISAVLFLPMLRYMLEDPNAFLYRTLSRVSGLEQPVQGSVISVFLNNMGRALTMFSWSDGEVWTISVPYRPALEVATGALFWLGAGLVLVRWLHRRHWQDAFLLLSIPVLLLPSVMALAFPAENPNLYRTGGALVPAFLLIALALDGLMTAIQDRLHPSWSGILAWGLAILLLAWTSLQSFDLVFNQYANQYRNSAWNSSEMGEVARTFTGTLGSVENVYVVGFAHWVDSRLVATMAGFPGRDFQLLIENLPATLGDPRPKLFFLNPNHPDFPTTFEVVRQAYPQGWSQLYESKVETKDFLMYFVPPQQ